MTTQPSLPCARPLSRRRAARLHRATAALGAVLCLLAAPAHAQDTARSFTEMVEKLALVPAGAPDSEVLQKVGAAVGFIKRMELARAQQAANEALQLDPTNAQLHFLNGFIYHLQARQGDTQKTELAIEGYRQAVRIDPAHWIAQEFRGLAHLDLKQFDPARLAFAEALLLTPDSTVSTYGLMVTSYLTGDARAACTMADRFQALATERPRGFVSSSVAVYAACGDFPQAQRMRELLASAGAPDGGAVDLQRADRRLEQWKAFHRRREQAAFGEAGAVAGPMRRTSIDRSAGWSEGRPLQLAQAMAVPALPTRPVDPPAPAAPAPAAGDTGAAGAPPAAPAAAPSPVAMQAPVEPAAAADAGPRMLLVDVVLLSTQEIISTSKGINLLGALTLQLGSATDNLAAFSRVVRASTGVDGVQGVTTAITRAVSVPALSYSLNIANAASSLNEVLARPTLAAIEGQPSEFFSGTNLSAGVVSTSVQGGTTIVPLDKRFGIKLAVTPSFLPQGQVKMKVEAQRTSLNASSDNARVAYQIEIGETTANANVVMNVGDTLVLSGMSEKTSSTTRDGVPGLQDVPGLQYVFSNRKATEIQRSVLILVTPRLPQQVAESPQGPDDTMARRMQTLRERFGIAQRIPANLESILTGLQANDYYREFRQGDVTMERWERMRSTGDRLREALGFLYY